MNEYDNDELELKALLEAIEQAGRPYSESDPSEVYFANLRTSVMERVDAIEAKRETSFIQRVKEVLFGSPARIGVFGTAMASVLAGVLYFLPGEATHSTASLGDTTKKQATEQAVNTQRQPSHILSDSSVLANNTAAPNNVSAHETNRAVVSEPKNEQFANNSTVVASKITDKPSANTASEVRPKAVHPDAPKSSIEDIASLDASLGESQSLSPEPDQSVSLDELSNADLEAVYQDLSK